MHGSEVAITEEQALFFRARRQHLAGAGAEDVAAAARAIVGAQAQQLKPALFALCQRTAGRPDAAALERELHEAPRALVHTWGQRETLHVYDAAADWALFAAVRPELAPAGRRGAMPTEREVQGAAKRVAAAGRPLTRGDLAGRAPKRLVAAAAEKVGAGEPARRLAAGRLFWTLALRGEVCVAGKEGNETAYAARALRYPDLDWPDPLPEPAAAGAELARRYLAAYAPASPRDVAHFFGARVREAKGWLARLADELVDVDCGGRAGLIALAADARELARKPPASEKAWPTRLLPTWDAHLMGHADKSWTVPAEDERPEVWRKAAMIPGTVLARGRVVATWAHTARAKRVDVAVTPLGGWREARHARPVEREARALARHLGVPAAAVAVG